MTISTETAMRENPMSAARVRTAAETNGGACGLFGTCGVRGVVGETITPEVVSRLGRAFGACLGEGARVCVGRDTRPSGPELEEALVTGLASSGAVVLRLGIVTTPALYFLTRELGAAGGVMVTASHNPPEYNGLKFCDPDGMSADQEAIEARFREPGPARAGRGGRVVDVDGVSEYMRRLSPLCPAPRERLRLVVDCACGPASLCALPLLRGQGHEVLEYNTALDLRLCDRVPEPMESTLHKTVAFLHANRADGGICFDGDADRVVFLDREGFLGFQIGNAALCQIALAEAERKVVVGSVETGRFVEEAVRRCGGSLYRGMVGDTCVARSVRELGAAIGVEECGHYVLPTIGWFSTTLYVASLLLARRDINRLRSEFRSLPAVYAAENRLDCPDADKKRVMAHVSSRMTALGGRITTVDGVRVDWEDGWLLVRPSGTSPYMKVNAEALSEDRLSELTALGTSLVKEALA